MRRTSREQFPGRKLLFLCGVFTLISVVILFSIPPDRPKTVGGDAASWLEPAYALLEHGAFVERARPNVPTYYRPPMAPLFNAAALWLGGALEFRAIVLGQIALVVAIALMTASIGETVRPGAGVWAAALVAFNPNIVSTALLVQSETVFTFFFTLALLGLTLSIQRDKTGHALLCGLGLGLATLTRPTSQYLILILPVAFLLAALLKGERGQTLIRPVMLGAAASIVALAVVLPWALAVAEQEGHPTLTMSEIKYRYLWDQLSLIEAQSTNSSYKAAVAQLEEGDYDGVNVRTCMSMATGSTQRVNCYERLVGVGWQKLFSYGFWAWSKSLGTAAASYLASGGAGNWHNLLGIDAGAMTRAWISTQQNDAASTAAKLLGTLSGGAIVISAICLGFSVLLKIVGAFGVVVLARTRDFAFLMVLLAVPAYFLGAALFLANSRYRIPAEPAFAVLAAIGIRCLIETGLRRHAKSPIGR